MWWGNNIFPSMMLENTIFHLCETFFTFAKNRFVTISARRTHNELFWLRDMMWVCGDIDLGQKCIFVAGEPWSHNRVNMSLACLHLASVWRAVFVGFPTAFVKDLPRNMIPDVYLICDRCQVFQAPLDPDGCFPQLVTTRSRLILLCALPSRRFWHVRDGLHNCRVHTCWWCTTMWHRS